MTSYVLIRFENRKGFDFWETHLLQFWFCCISILSIDHFSFFLIIACLFANMIFAHFDLTPYVINQKIDESREFLIWSISYGQIGFDKFFKCKILNYAFWYLAFCHY